MAKRKLGQHFLLDKAIASRIANTVLDSDKTILEIGPGKGMITKLLASFPKRRIVAIEKDETLYKELSLSGMIGVELINYDILKIDLERISDGEEVTILGNIPYYISKEIIDWIIYGQKFINDGTLLVQKEFFLKITSDPGSKFYNAQSVIFGILFNHNKLFEVKPGSFSPPPKVISTVFSFKKSNTYLSPDYINSFYDMLKTSFCHRRKTLVNNLGKIHDKNIIKEFLIKNDLLPDIRAEDMTRENLRELYAVIKKCSG